jgi:hypothetical protein
MQEAVTATAAALAGEKGGMPGRTAERGDG